MATLVCAHGTAILANRGPSELVAECIFYALQVKDMDYLIYSNRSHTPISSRTWSSAKEIIAALE